MQVSSMLGMGDTDTAPTSMTNATPRVPASPQGSRNRESKNPGPRMAISHSTQAQGVLRGVSKRL